MSSGNEISRCTQCGFRHIVSESCESYKERVTKDIKDTTSLIESGYAGVNGQGNIIDRREEDGVPIQENSLFGTPKPKPVKGVLKPNVIGMVDAGKTTTDVLERHLNKPGNNRVVVVGAGVDSCFPNLPAELRDKVEFVGDMSEIAEAKKGNLEEILKKQMSLKITNPYIGEDYAYDGTPTRSKYRASSNKKYVKRKKAKNGRTKKRRK